MFKNTMILIMSLFLITVCGLSTHTFAAPLSGKITGDQINDTLASTSHPSPFPSPQGIPAKLLEAIAMIESGQRNGKVITPWPWCVNVEGKSYSYPSKEHAVKAVRQFQAQGRTSIDVGVMQINLKHHPHAFANLEDAFNPHKNIAYATKFLLSLSMKYGDWHQAIKHYHSSDPTLGQNYLQKVLGAWARVKSPQGGFSANFFQGARPLQAQPLILRKVELPEPQSFQGVFPLTLPAAGVDARTIPISVSFAPLNVDEGRTENGFIARRQKKKERTNNPRGIFPIHTIHVRHRGMVQKGKERDTSRGGQKSSVRNKMLGQNHKNPHASPGQIQGSYQIAVKNHREQQARQTTPLVLAATNLLPLH